MRLLTTVVPLILITFAAGCRPASMTVMSFNIRYGTADDGVDAWPNRRDLVFETIRAYDPDLLCLQEVLAFQRDELKEALRGYRFVGVGRDDGEEAGEFAPIMFKANRFRLVDAGHFWLSETPQTLGSRGWDAALPRIVTWVRLQLLARPLMHLWVFNTHFDHRGETARLESARLLRRNIEILGGVPIIVAGDFNAAIVSAPYQTLTEDRRDMVRLIDPRRALGMAEEGGTYHGFRGDRGGARIDWILHNYRFHPVAASIDTTSKDGRYPSDHFPVTATLELTPRSRWEGF
jgi:endonuclease/exonuclease/phosphatase family metal-dependent hydrolase